MLTIYIEDDNNPANAGAASSYFQDCEKIFGGRMKILVINPNTTASMTEKIRTCVGSVVNSSAEIVVRNPKHGPVCIEGHYDEALSVPGLIDEISLGEAQGFDGFVVACFDDPAINACREIATGPVVGICEAAMHVATMVASNFSVVTTLSRSVPRIESLALQYGFERHCRRVRSAGIPVLALEERGSEARQRVLAEVRRAVTEDRCESVILGCAGMADLTAWLSDEAGIPVIDGVVAAVRMVEALVGGGFRTSKIGAYQPPHSRPFLRRDNPSVDGRPDVELC